MKKLTFVTMFLSLCCLFSCEKEKVTYPDEIQKTDTHQYFAPLTDAEIDDRSGCDPIVIPAGSMNALAQAIEDICEDGIIYFESGMHTETESITITKSVIIIGADGAILKVKSSLEPADPESGAVAVNPGLHVLNAPNTLFQNIEIVPVDENGGTAILFENSDGSAVMKSTFNNFQFSILNEKSDRMTMMYNTIVATSAWQTGEIGEAHGIVVVNGKSNYLSDNEVSNALFGIWACDQWGTCERNYTHHNYLGIILCNVPQGLILPSGEVTGSLIPAAGWKVRNNNSTDNFNVGYLVIDGANNNIMENNDASNNADYDIELTSDTYRFGFFTPGSFKNSVVAGDYDYVTIKDCGDNNSISGGILIDNSEDPCDDTMPDHILQRINEDSPVDPYSIAKELVEIAGWPVATTPALTTTDVTLMSYERQVITANIVHYKFEVSVGSHELDRIGIHRVVKETAENVPVVTEKNFFFQHGNAKDFVGMMLPSLYSDNYEEEFGLALFLAENDVDVWGIDQAWCMAETGDDVSYMENYGLTKAYTDLRSGIAIARIARYLTGNGLEKMMLAGYSSGVSTGFALLNHETQLDEAVRHAKSYIPIDLPIMSNDAAWNAYLVYEKTLYEGQLVEGMIAAPVPFSPAGLMAQNFPDEDSPIFEGFTNEQVPLFFGAAPLAGEGVILHYLAGNFVGGFPAGFKYVTWEEWLDFLISGIAYQPIPFYLEYALMSGVFDSPYDDHFAEIKVPIYNLAPIGGFGELTLNAFNYIGSTDVTHHIPALDSPENAYADFAHIDVFIANNAETVVWQPLLAWIEMH